MLGTRRPSVLRHSSRGRSAPPTPDCYLAAWELIPHGGILEDVQVRVNGEPRVRLRVPTMFSPVGTSEFWNSTGIFIQHCKAPIAAWEAWAEEHRQESRGRAGPP